MSKVAPSARAQVLILNARDEYGSRNPISEGAVALAEFMAEHQDEDRTSGFILFVGGWKQVTRMLADDVMPGDDWGQEMGRLTDGAVTANLWRRPFYGLIMRADGPGAIVELAQGEPSPVIPGAASVAVLGTVPPGPLWQFREVGEAHVRQLLGFGLGMTLSEPAWSALRDCANAAIADIRAGA